MPREGITLVHTQQHSSYGCTFCTSVSSLHKCAKRMFPPLTPFLKININYQLEGMYITLNILYITASTNTKCICLPILDKFWIILYIQPITNAHCKGRT